MNKYFIILFITLFLFSCQKELEIELPDFEQKPVVNCLFATDTNFVLNISHSISLNDSMKVEIANAKCYLFSENQLIDSFRYVSDGYYKSNIKPEHRKYYKLKIITPQFGEVSSTSYVPANVQILNTEQQNFAVSVPDYSSDASENMPFNRLSITFTDDASVNNYYELKIMVKRFWNDSLHDSYMENAYLYCYDNVVKNEDILDYEPNIFVFSDSLFNGQTKTIDFLYKPSWISWANGNSNGNISYFYGDYRLYYKFRSISKEMYDFRKSLIRHVYNQQTDDFQVFGDPVPMFSNINNGLGVFAGYTEVYDSIFVPDTNFYF